MTTAAPGYVQLSTNDLRKIDALKSERTALAAEQVAHPGQTRNRADVIDHIRDTLTQARTDALAALRTNMMAVKDGGTLDMAVVLQAWALRDVAAMPSTVHKDVADVPTTTAAARAARITAVGVELAALTAGERARRVALLDPGLQDDVRTARIAATDSELAALIA